MDTQTLFEKSKALLVSTLNIAPERVVPDAVLADLCTDSIQLFEIVLAFEKEFNLQTSYDDLIRIVTVQDTLDYLERALSSKPA